MSGADGQLLNLVTLLCGELNHARSHTSHHLVAIYAMGASGRVIEAAYEQRCLEQRLAFESPESITEKNFWDHLSDKRLASLCFVDAAFTEFGCSFYNSYLKFFTSELLEHGAATTMEKYIFAPKANIPDAAGSNAVPAHLMVNRFLSQLFHPMIHTGCGLEFGFLGLVAEGQDSSPTSECVLMNHFDVQV